MNVTIQDLMKQVNADPSEQPVLEMYLKNAKATAKRDINRPLSDLNKDELTILDQIVLQMATSFYLNRDGSAKNVSKSFSALNSLIEILRKPPLGG